MAHDEDPDHRLRELLGVERGVPEERFGGLALLVGGNMAIAASGQDGVRVRVDPEKSDRLASAGNRGG